MSEVEESAGAGTDRRAAIEQATKLANSGRLGEAETLFRAVLEADPTSIEAHGFLAALAFRQGRHSDAIASYETCVALRPGDFAQFVNLATVKELIGDMTGAAEAWLAACRLQPRDARLALFAGAALEAAGRREDAAVMFSLGDDLTPLVRAAKDRANNPPEIRRRSEIADRVFREHFTALHHRAVDEAEALVRGVNGTAAPDLSRVRNAVWVQTHDGPVTFPTPKHEPTILYMSDLAPVPVTPPECLPWVNALQAATADILGEFRAAMARGAELAPYVGTQVRDPRWSELRGQMDWSSLHLYKRGLETPHTPLFPRTLSALAQADIFRLEAGKPIEVLFSRLRPGAHIPPHTGTSNHRLTVHLPLIVPENCAIRVNETVHAWREGEIFAFDDSFEHEAWNRSDRDRVVLIFESHRPDVNADERFAIEHIFNVRERWLAARRIPELSVRK